MCREKLDVTGVADIVETEGLGYAINHYLSSDRIRDPELAKLWKEARKAMSKITELLAEAYP